MNTTSKPRLQKLDWGLLGMAALLLTTFLIPRPPTTPVAPPEESSEQQVEAVAQNPAESLAEQWGIQATGLRLAVGGNMLDFRYTVLDPNKAGAIQKQSRKAFLVDESTGAELPLENTARAASTRRQGRDLAMGSSYSLAFANPGGHFKAGSKVTVVMGDFRAENLVVQ